MADAPTDPAAPQDLPLQNAWTMWYDRYQGPGQSADQYQQGQQVLFEFDTIFGFWQCFDKKLPGSLEVKASLHMMKKGILPVWEDPENESGGFWVMRFPKDKIESVWRDLCLAAIGENFYSALRAGDAINGITVSIRRNDVVIQVWNKLAEEEPEQKRIINHVINSVLKTYQVTDFWYKPCQGHESYDSNFVPKDGATGASNNSSANTTPRGGTPAPSSGNQTQQGNSSSSSGQGYRPPNRRK